MTIIDIIITVITTVDIIISSVLMLLTFIALFLYICIIRIFYKS